MTGSKIGPVQMFVYFYIRDDKETFQVHRRKKFNKVYIIIFTALYKQNNFARNI